MLHPPVRMHLSDKCWRMASIVGQTDPYGTRQGPFLAMQEALLPAALHKLLLWASQQPRWPCRVVACNLILEYTLSVAVCARAFSAYGATLFGRAQEAVLLHAGPFRLDFCALALVLLLGVLLAAGTRESAAFNSGENLRWPGPGLPAPCTSQCHA